jgi:hypothetical protein
LTATEILGEKIMMKEMVNLPFFSEKECPSIRWKKYLKENGEPGKCQSLPSMTPHFLGIIFSMAKHL